MLGTQIKLAVAVVFVALLLTNGLTRLGIGQGPGGLSGVAQQLRPAAPAAPAVSAAPARAALPLRRDEHRIAADPRGHFSTEAEINGSRIPGMLVDTGATFVALSYEDASAAGVFPAPADFKIQVSTANGVAHVAHVKLRDVRIGNLVVYDVDAVVGEPGALGGSLLGMSFLNKLSRFEVDSGALVLRQ